MIVLGLDVSLNAPGVAYDDRAYTLHKPMSTIGVARLRHWRSVFDELFRFVDPDVAVIEGYSHNSRSNSTSQIGELGGVIRLVLDDQFIKSAIVPPKSVKKYATGNGGASKGNGGDDPTVEGTVVYAALAAGVNVPSRTNRKGEVVYDDNAADAFWLMQMGLACYDHSNPRLVPVPAANQDALYGVEWPKLST